mgnify:FL=1|tara:strand:+ start:972 stop:1325 length:354 start_codon:yes stop_codon:yes gene_type:complete
MDIKELYTADAHEEGAEIRILSPVDGKETDFYIMVKGIDSKSYREAVRAYHRKLINKEDGGEIDLLIAITKGWRGLESKGKDVKFTAKLAKDLYVNAPNIASQVDTFVAARRNFIKG